MNGCCSDKKWLHLANLFRKNKVDAICLIETMVDIDTVRKYTHHVSYDSWYIIPAEGKYGGIALGYFAKSSIEILSSSLNMIHILCDVTPGIKNCIVFYLWSSQ